MQCSACGAAQTSKVHCKAAACLLRCPPPQGYTASLYNLSFHITLPHQVWRSPHPPVRGKLWLGSRPMIHSGFLASWNGEGLDQQVLLRVRQILEGQQHSYSDSSGGSGGGGNKDSSSKDSSGGNHGDAGAAGGGSRCGTGMAPFETTVVRCCSRAHEEKEAELAEAAAAARAAEAAEAGPGGHLHVDEAELEAAASQLLSMASPFSGSSSAGLAGSIKARSRGGSIRSTASSTAGSGGRPFRIFVTGHRCEAAGGGCCAQVELQLQLLVERHSLELRNSSASSLASPHPALQPGRRSGHTVRI